MRSRVRICRLGFARLTVGIDVLDPGSYRASAYTRGIPGQLNVEGVHALGCKKEKAHKKPSCRRNMARFVPLLQNRIAYDSVVIVAI